MYAQDLTSTFIDYMKKAAPLHDIGKITVPDRILQKPGKLDAEEYEMMKGHAAAGGKLIRENISQKVHLHTYKGEVYTYDEALERYQLCLANAVVKRARASEKAYICLKSAWLLRGYQEQLTETGDGDAAKLTELKENIVLLLVTRGKFLRF